LVSFGLLLLLLLNNSSGDSSSNIQTGAPSGLNPGPDIVAGDMTGLNVYGTAGTQKGLAIGATSCNAGNQMVGFFPIPSTDHPIIASNLYRMSGGTENNDRFEQVGQSWVKHTFGARQYNDCTFGCMPGGDIHHLGAGCADIYLAAQGAQQNLLGSRAWINPFTGVFSPLSRDHTEHIHTATSHMLEVENADLDPSLNLGASYYAELLYVTPDEYTWCQTHPAECNMSNNASYRRYNITGPADYTFTPVDATERMMAAINAWTGATINPIEPDPGNDGRAYIVYKVTGPVSGIWHYEYAIYNQNLHRAIQSLSVPLGCGATASNVGFHAPTNPPGFPNDGTLGDAGFSNVPWSSNQNTNSINWSTETFAQNQNANAIRWGTLYNFRFDSDRPPTETNATIGFFKTGTPVTVAIQGPKACGGLTNVSTRMRVETGDNVGIGGFIITGTLPKDVALRGVGPSLTQFGVPDALADPTLELHNSSGALLVRNDDWQDDPASGGQLTALGLGLQSPNESGIVATLQPGAYTTILAGNDDGSGVGLVEVYDTNSAAASQLANISTRGFILTDSNVMIGGFILGGTNNTSIAVRGIGPSLTEIGLSPAIADPTLELHNSNGTILAANDNWQDDPTMAGQLTANGLALQNPNESGIFISLQPGLYTAILAGNNDGTGIGLVEIYNLQ